jgi:hypothetical protein
VREPIQGYGDASVPEQMLHHLRMHAATEQQGSTRVVQIVPADRGEASAIQKRLEVPVDDVLGIEWCSLPGGEHEVPIRPLRPVLSLPPYDH